MADMFDRVSGRYDLLNRVMTLGQDTAWREAMWREVPHGARVVLDLCTGSGSSLPGLREPGRLVVGIDVSLGMLEIARDQEGWAGWAPRLVAADAFHLPARGRSVDCVTIAFGIRNLRPRDQALREIRRVLRPGGRLIVLEATAPADGLLAPLHRFHLEHGLAWLGRLSPDPSAYRYLGRSILDFGSGEAFTRLLEAEDYDVVVRRRFLLGATQLWVAEPRPEPGDARPASPALQSARSGATERGAMPPAGARRRAEWRAWNAIQLAVSVGILGGFVWATVSFWRVAGDLPIEGWQRRGMEVVLFAGLFGFAVRSIVLLVRLFGAPPRR
jgi:demethylmenaquinone methyltransferase/2-methoxy-6-polyprenyl-1,4-benzoquinol methylase